MSSAIIVTLDFGSTSAKCLLFDLKGRNIAQVKKRWQFVQQQPVGRISPDFLAAEAWKTLSLCCREALQESGAKPDDVICVIPTSQRHGAVLLDKHGDAVFSFTNANLRSAPAWEQLSQQHGRRIYQETGRWPQEVFLPAHLCWLREQAPEVYGKVATILGIQDWLVYQLSRQLSSEPTIAGDLLLLNTATGGWSNFTAEKFGIDPALLPPLVDAGKEVGEVTRQAAVETGLNAGTPVLNGAADSQLAFLGVGAYQPLETVAVFGTSIPVMMLLEKPVFHPEAATWTNRHVFNGQWVLESNSGDSGLCLTNFRNMLLPGLVGEGDLASFKDLPSLLKLDEMAGSLDGRQESLLGSWGPVIFDGRKWPVVSGALRGLNLLGRKTAGIADLYLSLVENVGFAVLGNLKQLSKTADSTIGRVSLGGPAMESHIWQETMAGILGLPIHIPEEKEATPLGAAVLAACSSGAYRDHREAVAEMVRGTVVEADQERIAHYQDKYSEWLEVYSFSLD